MKMPLMVISIAAFLVMPGCQNEERPVEEENFQEYLNVNAIPEKQTPVSSENSLLDVHF